jgi:hypothetical protein
MTLEMRRIHRPSEHAISAGKRKTLTMDEYDVEEELLLDQLLFGTSFHKIVDGKKVRIDPCDVRIYWTPRMPWWRRLWRRLFHSAEGKHP